MSKEKKFSYEWYVEKEEFYSREIANDIGMGLSDLEINDKYSDDIDFWRVLDNNEMFMNMIEGKDFENWVALNMGDIRDIVLNAYYTAADRYINYIRSELDESYA